MRACLSILIALLMLAPFSAAAQAPGATSTLDAVAIFEDAPAPPLSLSTFAQMNFGKVAVPNLVKAGTICRYELYHDGFETLPFATQIDGKTSVSASAGTAGCAISGSFNAAALKLFCQDGMSVSYRIAYQSAGVKGATFTQPASDRGALRSTGAEPRPFTTPLTGNSGRFQCILGFNGKDTFVFLSAGLEVVNDGSLLRGGKVNVGTITFDVSY